MRKYIARYKRQILTTGIILVVIVAAEIALTCYIPRWREYFYNLLQNKEQSLFLPSMAYLALLSGGLALAQSLKQWVGQLTSFWIRGGIAEYFWDLWHGTQIRPGGYGQALSESLRSATSYCLEVVIEIIISLAIVISLVLSNWHNPTLLLCALGYTAVMSLIAYTFYHPTIKRDCKIQFANGAYRDALSLPKADLNALKTSFDNFATCYFNYIRIVMGFQVCSRFQGVVANLLPYFLMAGSYFSGQITLGTLMASVATFELIVVNTTILIQVFPRIVESRASFKVLQNVHNEYKGAILKPREDEI